MSVLRAVARTSSGMTISEVAAATELDRATARRLLLTFTDLKYLANSDGRFSLTSAVLDLGFAYLASISVSDLAVPHLRALTKDLQESSAAAVLDRHDILYVARVPSPRLMTVSLGVGARLPAHATSLGRVLVAGLPADERTEWTRTVTLTAYTEHTIVDIDELRAEIERVREQGWALVDQEFEYGVRSIAAPVVDRASQVRAAINVSAHAGRVDAATLRDVFLPNLLTTARELSRSLI